MKEGEFFYGKFSGNGLISYIEEHNQIRVQQNKESNIQQRNGDNMSLLNEAKTMKDTIVEYRRHIHQHAEIGLELPMTCAYVMEQLTEMGYEPKEVGGGVVAVAGGKKPVICMRADMISILR